MAAGLRDDPDALELVLGELLVDAAEAREDVARFFEFVLRDEQAGNFVRVARHQRLQLEFMAAHRNCVIMEPVNHAKCHGRGTPILMADGALKPVERVRRGDRVMGWRGPVVVRSTSSGRGELYRVVPARGGEPFVVNEDHLLTVVDTTTERVSDITVAEYVRRSKWYRDTHLLFREPVVRFEREVASEIDPYFLGVWFGDGNHSLAQGVRLTNIDPEVRAACAEVARQYGLVVTHRKCEQSFALSVPGGRGHGASLFGNPLVREMRSLFGTELSMRALTTTPFGQRLEFLAGFIDADGSLKDNCFYLSQKRNDWADAIAFIARSVGLSVSKGVQVVDGKTYARLCIFGDTWNVPTRIARKRAGPRGCRRHGLRTRFKVEALGVGDFYGFTIGGDGRYLLGDFTVTHNTFTLGGDCLFRLGQNPLERIAFVSAAEAQAQKPVANFVRQYIENSYELGLVFPDLRPTVRPGEPWTMTDITVDRPPGIRDPSVVARGMDSKKIAGSRWTTCYVDDLSNAENTNTPEQRDQAYRFLLGLLKSRMEPMTGRVIVTCVAWHRDDTTHKLMMPKAEGGAGWPGLIMRADGGIVELKNCPGFDSDLIEPIDDFPADHPDARYRLKIERPAESGTRVPEVLTGEELPTEERTLWPERWPREALDLERQDMHPVLYEMNYNCRCRDDTTALCKQQYIDRAIALGAEMGLQFLHRTLPAGFPYLVFAGVDLAFSKADAADECAIFLFGVYPKQIRVPLWIESGKWGADELYQRLVRINADFRPAGFAFENNAAQEGVRRLMVTADVTLPLKEHHTGATKNSIAMGVPSIFGEMANGAWAIPSDNGKLHPELKKWTTQCLYYTPAEHTGDTLMASYFARDLAKKYGALARTRPDAGNKIAAAVMRR